MWKDKERETNKKNEKKHTKRKMKNENNCDFGGENFFEKWHNW